MVAVTSSWGCRVEFRQDHAEHPCRPAQGPGRWTEVLGSERLTGATLDRLTHRCQNIETKGESYRLKDAKARITRPTTQPGRV